MENNVAGAQEDGESRQQQLLREFLKVQEHRAGLYSTLHSGFTDYLKTGSEVSFQQLCGRITTAFNDCSRQVIDIQAALRGPDVGRQDLADILKDVQAQEKQNLKMTATLQVLRKAGRPSDRAHEMEKKGHHQCSHGHEEESSALELAESDAEFDAAYKEATQALQEARTAIHEYMEEVRYELASSAVFGLPETGLAIIHGAGGTQRLPRIIGRARAKELVYTGRRIDGGQAEAIGLVNHSVQAGNAYQKAVDIAHQITKQGPLPVKLAKVAIDRGSEVDTASGMITKEACYAQVLRSKDRLEGLVAFAEKRKPGYTAERMCCTF